MNRTNYDPREDYRQSSIIAFVCGAVIGLMTGVLGTIMILTWIGEI